MTTNGIAPGLVIAAPASRSGKTVVTLGILRAFRETGICVASAKTGPDYIDPRFHAVASGRRCASLDGWAMRSDLLSDLACGAARGADLLVVEGVMGLFDGAPCRGATTNGSTASLARQMGWPVLLVIDAAAQAQSVAALAAGFRDHCRGITIAGVLLNRVAGARHDRLLRNALAARDIAVFGAIPRRAAMRLPSRHLGLVQAAEHPNLERFIADAAACIADSVDLEAIRGIAETGRLTPAAALPRPIQPLGQRIAVACDDAFSFVYNHVLAGWRRAGAEIMTFSPLADEAPPDAADAVYLPGGYPELHAGRLAANRRFMTGLRSSSPDRLVFGECGGYMVMGDLLTDCNGQSHRMAGLLGLECSFAGAGLTLGYRWATTLATTPFGPAGVRLAGHEFHHATATREDGGEPVFRLRDSEGAPLGRAGLRRGAAFGSFLHLIDLAAATATGRDQPAQHG